MSHYKVAPPYTKHLKLIVRSGGLLRQSYILVGALAVFSFPGCSNISSEVAISEPDPDLVFVRGYRSTSDACKLTGESSFTIDFLDDAADLVTCPTGDPGAATLVSETNATLVTQTNSFSLFSVPKR